MDYILDKSYDLQFEKIAGLSWNPWVGKDYAGGERRVLIVGESHYIKEESEEVTQSNMERFKSDKSFTRACLNEVLIDGDWGNRTYLNLMEALCDRSVVTEDKEMLQRIAFYNFIQRLLDYSCKERPQAEDYRTAWECFLKVVNVLQPTDCVLVGLESTQAFEEVMSEHGIRHSGIETQEVVNNSYPRKATLELESGNILDILFIRHSSAYFSPEQWHEFLKRESPEIMKWLNRN